MYRSFVLLLLVVSFPANAAPQDGKIEIEVNESADQFRIIVSSDAPMKFDAIQLEAPYEEFPPGSAGVLVMQGAGQVVGCHADNQPNYPALLGSNSLSAQDVKMVSVGRGKPYVTPWYPSQSLFYFFDECVDRSINKNRSSEYSKYQIHVDIVTSRGAMSTKTAWLDFHDFETSGWGRKMSQPR